MVLSDYQTHIFKAIHRQSIAPFHQQAHCISKYSKSVLQMYLKTQRRGSESITDMCSSFVLPNEFVCQAQCQSSYSQTNGVSNLYSRIVFELPMGFKM